MQRSTTISENMGDMEGLRITGTVSGRTGLEFEEGYLTLSGRGEVTYEDFHIETRAASPVQSCTFFTSPRGGYFEAPEVVLFRDALPPLAHPGSRRPAGGRGERLLYRAGHRGVGPDQLSQLARGLPLPNILHFFAGFYSIHGGEVDGHPSEVDQARGGW